MAISTPGGLAGLFGNYSLQDLARQRSQQLDSYGAGMRGQCIASTPTLSGVDPYAQRASLMTLKHRGGRISLPITGFCKQGKTILQELQEETDEWLKDIKY